MSDILDPIQISGALTDLVTIEGSLSDDFVPHYLVDSQDNQLIDSNDNIQIDFSVTPSVFGTLAAVESLESEISVLGTILGEISLQESVTAAISIPMSIGGDSYQGEYTVTPTTETQVLNTQHKVMSRNVTINPIPSNYGLITWNGATLTVS